MVLLILLLNSIDRSTKPENRSEGRLIKNTNEQIRELMDEEILQDIEVHFMCVSIPQYIILWHFNIFQSLGIH